MFVFGGGVGFCDFWNISNSSLPYCHVGATNNDDYSGYFSQSLVNENNFMLKKEI